MKKHYRIELEIADGYTWVTCFHLLDGTWVEWLSAKLDDVLKVPNAIYDLPALAAENHRGGIELLYLEVHRAVNA